MCLYPRQVGLEKRFACNGCLHTNAMASSDPTSDSSDPTSDSSDPTGDNSDPTCENSGPTSDNSNLTSQSSAPTSDSSHPTSDSSDPRVQSKEILFFSIQLGELLVHSKTPMKNHLGVDHFRFKPFGTTLAQLLCHCHIVFTRKTPG